ncbi:uncharacterized protein LOC135179289 isoform X2 [Pogoniulus pusillus]|uniref:uncharacterized protein LOC135179289 isoform X2 n=1 Tax=Pogoniulus pusillus TaxID=488313 RepID=UPI0030B92D5E
MDSLQSMLLCFLLLTVAPGSSVAMPSAKQDERTPGSFPGETAVTVYLCRGCERSVCDTRNYESYEKIIDTQNETTSHGAFRLETTKTCIRLCYQHPTYIPEGVLAIVWQRPDGIGDLCGTVNSEASSENVMGSITETCCEAEIKVTQYNMHLKCYTEKVANKDRKLSADTPEEENNRERAQSVTDEQSSSSVIVAPAVVTFVVCGAALAVYCARRRRSGRGIFLFSSEAVGLPTYLTPI